MEYIPYIIYVFRLYMSYTYIYIYTYDFKDNYQYFKHVMIYLFR